VDTLEDAVAAVQGLRDQGAKSVLLTLGERGSLLVNGDGHTHVQPTAAREVETRTATWRG
jgi:fructose-1-phosphate kinase PfkB-like protein